MHSKVDYSTFVRDENPALWSAAKERHPELEHLKTLPAKNVWLNEVLYNAMLLGMGEAGGRCGLARGWESCDGEN
ncbi:MAG: hypothetical protein GY822_24860 [Deltaproteobacteria bacterium]|nr:hypothetical protein [Deltaproteobacteria bacterium]